MTAGSTAAGKPIPPHFQFQTRAQSVDTQSININLVTFLPNIIGKFGTEEKREWAVTFGYNAKGGMDNEQFKEYFRTNIAPLYPDAEDKVDKRVMVKVDSGPGRLEIDFLAEARTSGFIIYPSVPNTTAVTQETDQSYGPFKSKFAQNLKALSDARINGDFSTSFPPWIVGLLVFGGIDPVSQFVVESAFEFGFSQENNLNAWRKCGAAPLTRCCLENHSQVRREMGDNNDRTNQMMQDIQTANDISTHFLTANGYNGDALKAMVKKVKRVAVTAKHSEERINMIAEATNHGSMWQAMGGSHYTTDDVFLGVAKRNNERKKKELMKKKEMALKNNNIEQEARTILVQAKGVENYNIQELKVLLQYYKIKVTGLKKNELVEKWKVVLQSGVNAPVMEGWSVEEEEELNKLTNQKVTMGDTALARHQSLIERQMGNIIKNMSKEKRDELKRKLEDIDDSPDKSQIKPTLPPPNVVKTQDNLEEPSGGESNEILEASI
jgi:hypothetical protein